MSAQAGRQGAAIKPTAPKAATPAQTQVGGALQPGPGPGANQTWTRLALGGVRPKLALGAPDDPLEREADRVSIILTRDTPNADPGGGGCVPGTTPLSPSPTPGSLRRKCAACERDEELRRSPEGGAARGEGAGPEAPAEVHEALVRTGEPLDRTTRDYFEPRLGLDLGPVRVHRDGWAARSAQAVGARAYTVGSRIAFAQGQYDPGSTAGRRLLAHELVHVAQGATGRLWRAPGESDPFERMELALVKADPPTFRITLSFKSSVRIFSASLHGSREALGGLRVGRFQVGAMVGTAEDDKARMRRFFIPGIAETLQNPLWIHVADDADPEDWNELKRAHTSLTLGSTVPLDVLDATAVAPQGEEAGKGAGAGGEQKPKTLAAEPWLDRELIPALLALLKERHRDKAPDKLIGYIGVETREREGDDPAWIQAERPSSGGGRQRSYVKVLKSKWVGQPSQARQAYTEATATAILDKLDKDAAKGRLQELDKGLAQENQGLAVPAWVIKLKAEVDKRLAAIRKSVPEGQSPPRDLPDRLQVAAWVDAYYLEIIIEQPAKDDPTKLVWNRARMTPALHEDQLQAVDDLVARVRAQTALLRANPVRAPTEDSDGPKVRVLMPEIPSQIMAPDLDTSGATVPGAENTFQMSVQFARYFSYGTVLSGPDLHLVTVSAALGLNVIDYEWKVVRLTADNVVGLSKGAPQKGETPSDLVGDLTHKDIDQAGKLSLVQSRIDYVRVLDDPAHPVLDTNRGRFEHEFGAAEGVLLVMCRVQPRPLREGDTLKIFPPSRAVFPLRVVSKERRAQESVNQAPERIKELEQTKDQPTLSEERRREIESELARLRGEEGMSQLQIAQTGLQELGDKIVRFEQLRTWMLTDRKAHPTTTGSDTEDPFVVRLALEDQVRGSHLFDAWGELYSMVGENAYSVVHLDQPEDSEDGRRNALNAYLAVMREQKRAMEGLIGTIKSEQGKFLGGQMARPVATLVAEENGQTTPLLLMLGETTDSKPGAYRFRILDLTLRATPLFAKKEHTYVGEVLADRDAALRSAFVAYGRENQYPQGLIVYRLPPSTATDQVDNVKTAGEYAEQAAMYLGLIALVASVAASGGATTPALAAFVAVISVSSALLGGYLAMQHIQRRQERGTLELDEDLAFDAINVIASVVGLGGMARTAQLGRVAKAASTAGSGARAVAALGQIQRLGKLMLVFDAVTLGGTAVLTSVKVSIDVERVKALGLPKHQEELLLRQVAFDAVAQGAMLAFQTVTMARGHLESYRTKLEEGRYQTMEERGWLDADGRLGTKAPPFLRAAVEGGALTSERPPFDLDAELPQIRQAVEEGRVQTEAPGSEYDLSIPIKNAAGEDHRYRRRRGSDVFCRFTTKFCLINKKDLDKVREQVRALEESKPATGPKAGAAPTAKPAQPPTRKDQVHQKVRSDLAELHNRIDENQRELARLEGEISLANQEVARLKKKVDELPRGSEERTQALKEHAKAKDRLKDAEGAGLLDERLGYLQARSKLRASEDSMLQALKLERPALREPMRKQVRDAAAKTADGKYIDPNTKLPIEGEFVYGHKYGREHRRLVLEAAEKKMNQSQFADWVNSHPEWFQIESPASNLSHQYEKKGVD